MIEIIQKLRGQKKGKAFIAKKLGISEKEIDLLEGKANTSANFVHTVGTAISPCTITYSYSEDLEKGTRTSEAVSDFEPKSHEELAKLHKVDLSKYKIASYWTKQKGDKFTSSLLCSLIKPSDLSLEDFTSYLKGYKSSYKPIAKTKSSGKEEVDVEISLADFHLDKLDITKETIEDRVKQYQDTLQQLINRVIGAFDVNRLVFVIGNDFLHTDTIQNTTTSGTPLQVSCTWNEAYEVGFDLLVESISKLLAIANEVEIILVQGNHARTKEYFLAHALEAYFKDEERLDINRDFTTTKFAILGNTFVGYHHGNCKIFDLPLIFATSTDSAELFGMCPYREVHTGDKHHYLAKEIQGVRVQQLPSLSGTDRWHADNNFINSIRAGLAMCYSEIEGKVAEYEARI